MIIKMSLLTKSIKPTTKPKTTYHAIFYGDRINTDKLSRRFSCATKFLPISVNYTFEHDPLKALDAGVSKDPTLVFDGKLQIEGLIQAEDITEQVENYLA